MAEQVKRALLVGCNYPGTDGELAGCINDLRDISLLLRRCFGFQDQNITVLTDEDRTEESTTNENIKNNLRNLVNVSAPGDILFLFFAGHGDQVVDQNHDENDGLDEVILTQNFGNITDDELREILTELNPDVKFTMLCDCCHSGTILDGTAIPLSRELDAEDVDRASSNLPNVVAITGCKAEQLASEEYTNGGVRGLFTSTTTRILRQVYQDSNTTLTNKQLAQMVSKEVLEKWSKQQICLECTADLADKNFIDW
eukprot:g2746.t1